MPLLCISLLALLLLPLSLSCDSKRPTKEVREDYRVIVQTVLNKTNEIIATFLQSSSCPVLKHKLRDCTQDNADVVCTLHRLTCKMKTLSISHTEGLVSSVLSSLQCSCLEKATKAPSVKTSTVTRKRRSKQTKKLCKAKEILSAMTNCYQMLYTILPDT